MRWNTAACRAAPCWWRWRMAPAQPRTPSWERGLPFKRPVDSLASGLENGQPAECCDWVELFWETFASARAALIQLAEEHDEPLRDFATTLTCLAATPEQLIVGQMGDGAVVAGGADGVLNTVTTLQRGEYANETNFLTQEQALDQVAIQVIELPVQALAVMSDGLTRLALKRPTNEPHLPFFKPLFAFVEASALRMMAPRRMMLWQPSWLRRASASAPMMIKLWCWRCGQAVSRPFRIRLVSRLRGSGIRIVRD